MLILLLLYVLGLILGAVTGALGAFMSLIPYYAELNDAFGYGIGLLKGIFLMLPYLEVVWNVFLLAVTVEVFFMLSKFMLGSRNIINMN